jgi:sulfur-oxidizing protein SoxY
MLGRSLLCAVLLVFGLPETTRAELTEVERSARWADLRHTIFGDRVVEDAADLVAIDAPMRAEDAAIVPVAQQSAAFQPELAGRGPRRRCERGGGG